MATVVLSAAGSAVGTSIGGSALGVGAAAFGRAAGAIAGSLLDQKILGQGSRAVEVGRARSLRLQSASEGVPIQRVFGRMRVTGQIIWSTRFLERQRTSNRGGKGTRGQRVREFSYSISFAVGLCEGRIDRVGRVWADGKELDTMDLEMRVYDGSDDQLPDPKMEAVEGFGLVPAYRGLAYVVFEDFPVSAFGNRIPQLSFEVLRSNPNAAREAGSIEAGQPLAELISAVALSPGTGEFALDPDPVRYLLPNGTAQYANVHNARSRADFDVSLEQLGHELPECEAVSLVVSWFGDDLRCGRCKVEPRIEAKDRRSAPYAWTCSGLTPATARLVGRDPEGRPNFGGTPSDQSVIRAISALKATGKAVLLYPFLLMDIPVGSTQESPYNPGEPQAAFPWRGRITLDRAPGVAGSSDQTGSATSEVRSFFGTASAADFAVSEGAVAYSGPEEWTWRRFILHLSALAAAAGGVESICIGSELRGLTQIRSARTTFPAVDELRALASEVRLLLPGGKISYAADWSEYFGHRPVDGSGDVIFHLDPLWADPNIDFIAIDDYTSLADWRYEDGHRDRRAGYRSVYSLSYLSSNIEGGENYDWYYADEPARAAQDRTPISDTAYGEDWIFRAKDIRNWWANSHHNRIDGVRESQSTAWIPQSKPIWLTETGCPAVDLGANAPNVFFDGKSSESGLPIGSRGVRDEEMQRRFLQAKLGYWASAENNPLSPVYGGQMITRERTFVWTWDARPWPDFPLRESIWADGPSHRLGHWITGRILSGALADVVAEICAQGGVYEISVDELFGVVHGFVVDTVSTVREALQPLMTVYGFDCFESDGLLRFRMRASVGDEAFPIEQLVDHDEPGRSLQELRASEGDGVDVVRFHYLNGETDFRQSSAESRSPRPLGERVAETSLALNLPASTAQAVCDRWMVEADRAGETALFALPLSMIATTPADLLSMGDGASKKTWRIDRASFGVVSEVEATRILRSQYLPRRALERPGETVLAAPMGPIEAVFMNLPVADGTVTDHRPFIAVTAEPWSGTASVSMDPTDGTFREVLHLTRPSVMGRLATVLPPGAPHRVQRAAVEIEVPDGSLQSVQTIDVLNGANLAAVNVHGDDWEVVQFAMAVQVAPGRYRLSGLLRGQRGTERLSSSEIEVGTRFILLDDGVRELATTLDDIGLERTYKIGPSRFGPSHPSYVELTGTPRALGLRPFAPAHLRAAPVGSGGGLEITWVRRARIGGDSWATSDVPLAEEFERYRVRIKEGAAVLRDVEVSESRFVYSEAMQSADGRSGAIAISVAQISQIFGPGSERVIISHD